MSIYDGGTFTGLNTALSALQAEQAAMDVTGHNIANISTPGYTRQAATFTANQPYTLPSMDTITTGQIGTGVQVTGYSRARDQYLDGSLRNQYSTAQATDGATSGLAEMQSVFNELGGNGISDKLTAFTQATSALAGNATDTSGGLHQAVVTAGTALATSLNQLATGLATVSSEASSKVTQDITDINTIATQISTLNKQINLAQVNGQQPNDLLDQRDTLLDTLSQKANVTITTAGMPTGTVQVSFAQPGATAINLVDPSNAAGIGTSNPIAQADVTLAYNGTPGPPAAAPTLTGGDLFAQMNLVNKTIPQVMGKLDALASSIVTQVNLQQDAGFDLQGNAGTDMFDVTTNPATAYTAAGITFSTSIASNPSLLATASSGGSPPNTGDGSNMLAIYNLIQSGNTDPTINNQTFGTYYGQIVGTVGNLVAKNASDSANQDAVTSSFESRRSAISGVSLDEEMSNMLKYQQSYNAAARVLTTFDSELDTLINRTGKVGL